MTDPTIRTTADLLEVYGFTTTDIGVRILRALGSGEDSDVVALETRFARAMLHLAAERVRDLPKPPGRRDRLDVATMLAARAALLAESMNELMIFAMPQRVAELANGVLEPLGWRIEKLTPEAAPT